MAKYDEGFKRAVVREYLAGALGYQSLAVKHGINPTVLEYWVAHYRQHGDAGLPAYRRELAARGLTQSMSRKGNCLDNAAMESFFGTLKSEFFYLNQFDSIEQLQAGIRQYIRYYNHHRIKTKLKGLSPVQYRTQPSSA